MKKEKIVDKETYQNIISLELYINQQTITEKINQLIELAESIGAPTCRVMKQGDRYTSIFIDRRK